MAPLTPGALHGVAREALAGTCARVHAWLLEVESFALPQRCPACGSETDADRVPCPACAAAIPRLGVPLCMRCLAAGAEPAGCGRHPGHRAWAAWIYEERAASAVHAFKYHGRTRLAKELSAPIAESLPAAYRPDLIVEVPLHSARSRERGYNQAALLADALAERLGCPRLPEALLRQRPTRPQARLGPGARRANLAGAIRVRAPERLEGREVLVVDDVITTGSTMEACLDALTACGARPAGAALAWAS